MIMKNIVGILVLMVVSTNVMSEWTKISDTNHANRTPYVEYHSILKKDNKVKMSTLTDFKKAEKYVPITKRQKIKNIRSNKNHC